ncbi:MAG: metal ABC transporter ATP-binding protein [Sphaerospermopsis sp. SIO1G1]|nr:metal ABC transporter ATP-binding protein [Sphaerospermopsis sp. SIO1G1]
MLQVKNLSVSYRGNYALREINFNLEPGQLVGIFGPNGAGKSTMIKAMLNLIPATNGVVTFRGNPLKQKLDKVAYVAQRAQIDWDYPVKVKNVVMMARTIPTGLFRYPSRQSRELVKMALKKVDIWDLRNRQIGELSGGQQQRVFLARTLAQQAEIFFFDEPFVGVDRKTENIIFEIFHELREQGKIVMVVSHDLGESIKNYSDILLLNKTVIAFGRREEVLNQRNLDITYENYVLPSYT